VSRPPVLDTDALPDLDARRVQAGIHRIEASDSILPTLRFFVQLGCLEAGDLDAAVADPARAERALLDLLARGETAFHVASMKRTDAILDWRTPMPSSVSSRLAYRSEVVTVSIRRRIDAGLWQSPQTHRLEHEGEAAQGPWGVITPTPELAEYNAGCGQAIERLRCHAIDALSTFLYPVTPLVFLAHVNDDMMEGERLREIIQAVMADGHAHPGDCDDALDALVERISQLNERDMPESVFLVFDPREGQINRDDLAMLVSQARMNEQLLALCPEPIQWDTPAAPVVAGLREAIREHIGDASSQGEQATLDWISDVADAVEAMERLDPGGRSHEPDHDSVLGESDTPFDMTLVVPSDDECLRIAEQYMERTMQAGTETEYAMPVRDNADAERLQMRLDRLHCGHELLVRLNGIET